MYIIADLKNMQFMKNEVGDLSYYETEEDTLLVCGIYELQDVWVLKLIHNHKE